MTSNWTFQQPRMSTYWIERFLWTGGFIPARLARDTFEDDIQPALDAGIWHGLERSMPEKLSGCGFEVTENNAGIVVRYKGPPGFEPTALEGYRQVLSWCVYNVEETDDPDNEYRRMLKILPVLDVLPPAQA